MAQGRKIKQPAGSQGIRHVRRRQEDTTQDDDSQRHPGRPYPHHVQPRHRCRCDETHRRADGRRRRHFHHPRIGDLSRHLYDLAREGVQDRQGKDPYMKAISSASMSLPRHNPETTLSIWMLERICNGGICRYDFRRRTCSWIQ
jgi:hypothetical protein